MFKINYDIIRLVHSIDGILSNDETSRRLGEVRRNSYPQDRRCAALAKCLARKSDHLNATEIAVLRDFPEYGIDLGNISHAFLFAEPLRRASLAWHKAVVSLVRLGYLVIVEGYELPRRTKMKQVLVKVWT